jgi:DNA-binding IclR family transcriptional regulator
MFKPVQSLQRGLTLIEAISARREGINLKDLAQAIGCSSAATYHLVQTLADSGFVKRLENPARYVLGTKLIHLLSNENQDRYYDILYDELFKLQKQLPGSCLYYSEYVGNHITVNRQIDANNPTQIQRQGTFNLPPYLSAGSTVHMAYWPEETRNQYMQIYPYQEYGQLVWGAWENYETLLIQTRKDGCVLIPERNPLHLKLGLPILGKSGELMAALTVQWNQTERKGLRDKIKILKTISLAAGQRITQRLQGA